MSRFKTEQLCFDLAKKENMERFKSNPEEFISKYALTEAEKTAIKSCEIETLYTMGVVTQALSTLSRVFGNDNATYVQRLRRACALPEHQEQLRILRNRGR